MHTEGRAPGSTRDYEATAGELVVGVPIAVLINGGTASSAEVVAASLNFHRGANLIGERTFGKGTVQSVIPIGKDHALKLTTARYRTPDGHDIEGIGVEPDKYVTCDSEFSAHQSSLSSGRDAEGEKSFSVVGQDTPGLLSDCTLRSAIEYIHAQAS